jgi:cell division protein FtsQ
MAGSGPGPGRRWRTVRLRREARPAPRHRRVRRIALVGVLVLGLVGVAAWVLLGTAALSVRRIEVTGSTVVSPDQVKIVAAVPLGTPLARVDTAAVGDRVKALPSVADVDVRRAWPSTLVIAVTERQPVAVVASGRRYLELDPTGVVFNTVPAKPAGLPLLVVRTPGPADPATRAGLTVVAALTPRLRAALKQVVADSPTSIHLDLADGRLIVWGDATQSAKKAQVATALLGRASTRIDVSAPDVVAIS